MKYSVLNFIIKLAIIHVIVAANTPIEDVITGYFESPLTKELGSEWSKHKKSLDNAIKLALKESFGRKNLNIFEKKMPHSNLVAKGFYLTDNVVDLLLMDLELREMPHLRFPEVGFSFDKNALRLETGLSKIFVDAEYLLFRNHSAVLFDQGLVQDAYMNSPFSFQQVYTVGKLAVIAEDCYMIGTGVTTFMGSTVNMGYNTFRLTECKFSVEIYKDTSGSPPVIAPYFTKDQGSQLMRLIAQPISVSVATLLQGCLFSYVNTSAIFGDNLMKYRHHQEKLFKQTSAYMIKAVRALNKLTIEKNAGRLELKDFEIYWDEKLEILGDEILIKLMNMTLNGLDTAYSTSRGGAYVTNTMRIGETIRFHTMQLQGKINFAQGTMMGTYDFAAEIKDVSVAVTIKINSMSDKQNKLKSSTSLNRYEVVDWRALEYSMINLKLFLKERIACHALVSGYLMNEIPRWLIGYMAEVFPEAIAKSLTDDDSLPNIPLKGEDGVNTGENDILNAGEKHKLANPNIKLKMKVVKSKKEPKGSQELEGGGGKGSQESQGAKGSQELEGGGGKGSQESQESQEPSLTTSPDPE